MQRVLSAAAVVCAVAVQTSCGGGSGSSSPTAPSAPAPGTLTITITRENGAQSFSPSPASAGGQMVVFRNADSIVHRVQLNDGTLDTGDIAPGATSRPLLMPAAGTHYHCTLHPTMTGAVSAASGDTPACQGPYCDPAGY